MGTYDYGFEDEDTEFSQDFEMASLVSSTPSASTQTSTAASHSKGKIDQNGDEENPSCWSPSIWKFSWTIVALGVIVISTVSRPQTTTDPAELALSTMSDDSIEFQCPVNGTLSQDNEDTTADYNGEENQPSFGDDFLETFRDHKFDGWGKSFEQHKAQSLAFKSQYFVPYLKSGDRIFESACGIGLNLYATLEILQEVGQIHNVTVYGNEYLAESTDRANDILERLINAQSFNDTENHDGNINKERIPIENTRNHLGAICNADSSDLSFVPENAFDLVYTGYLSLLWDPLDLAGEFVDNYDQLSDLCEKNPLDQDDWKNQKLIEIMQQREEAWFSNWFQQMIRIAKAGAPVVVESISLPFCEDQSDYGGVSKAFWETGVERYGWDVNPSTLAFGKRGKRYHVFFLKNRSS